MSSTRPDPVDDPGPYAWEPDPATVAASNATRFMRALGVERWEELVRRGDEDPDLLEHLAWRLASR